MSKSGKVFLDQCKYWFLNQPIFAIIILMVGIYGGINLLISSLQSSSEIGHGENDPEAISLRIHVRNTTDSSRTIAANADFTIVERVILMMRECVEGHIGLSPLSTAASGAFTIPSGQTKDFRASLPRIPTYMQLLARGSCNLYISVGVTSSNTTALGAIPFKAATLKKYYMDIDLKGTD